MGELFTGKSDDPDVRDALDPGAEARRLQSEGIAAAPIDPSDREDPKDAEENHEIQAMGNVYEYSDAILE